MSLEGQLRIGLSRTESGFQCSINSSRPVTISNIFKGKTPDEVLKTLPMIYSICGTAQGIASLMAFESALDISSTSARQFAQELLVDVETIREHYWRISLDWPHFLNNPAPLSPNSKASTWLQRIRVALYEDASPFVLENTIRVNDRAVREIGIEIEQILTQQVFGMEMSQWLAIDSISSLTKWANNGKTVAAQFISQNLENEYDLTTVKGLPKLENQWLKSVLLSEQGETFSSQPHIDNNCAETTPLTRQMDHPLIQMLITTHGAGLLTRLLTRLIELANLTMKIQSATEQPGNNQSVSYDRNGVSQIEAARGRLIHCVSLDQGLVSEYRIVAPTEWNFHPQGVLKYLLESIKDNEPEPKARMIINAIDPCVAYTLDIH